MFLFREWNNQDDLGRIPSKALGDNTSYYPQDNDIAMATPSPASQTTANPPPASKLILDS